ncbi:hypothetical protein, partial [Nitrosococcus oceani]|uniref:hypothetical protein n=1 Tax=Nitrosococcus oceani TaxID=1229 RepID=UPI001E40C387
IFINLDIVHFFICDISHLVLFILLPRLLGTPPATGESAPPQCNFGAWIETLLLPGIEEEIDHEPTSHC